MKLFILLSLLSFNAFTAELPEPVVTTAIANGTYAVVAGKLAAKPEHPIGVSVQNGVLMYSTITDAEGRWGLVIRTLSSGLKVNSFDLTRPAERSAEVVHKIQ